MEKEYTRKINNFRRICNIGKKNLSKAEKEIFKTEIPPEYFEFWLKQVSSKNGRVRALAIYTLWEKFKEQLAVRLIVSQGSEDKDIKKLASILVRDLIPERTYLNVLMRQT